MTNHGNSGQRKREGKIKVLGSSCQAATVLCSYLQCLAHIQRNNDDPKAQEENKFSSFIPSMVLKCSSRTESSSTFVSELIVLELLSHWT